MLYRLLLFCLIFMVNSLTFATSHYPQEFLNSVVGSKNEGQQIVQHYCAVCHAEKPLIQLGAPRVGVEGDWRDRLKQGMQKIFLHTEEGFNAMPARGGCFECSDKQLMLAIIAMLPGEKSQEK